MSEHNTAWVVGMGEVGRRLARALEAGGWTVIPVTRQEGWDSVGAGVGPVLVCVREEALPEVVGRLEGVAPERLVFVQNGWIRPALEGVPRCSRGLIWFTSKGDFFAELRPSPFSGPAAWAVADALTSGGLAAQAVIDAEFAALEAEKMGFNCVVGLPLAVHGLSLGEYLAGHPDEARQVFDEAVIACSRVLGVAANPRWWDDFVKVCGPLDWVKVREAKALDLRNGAVVRLAAGVAVPAPANRSLLERAGYPLPPEN